MFKDNCNSQFLSRSIETIEVKRRIAKAPLIRSMGDKEVFYSDMSAFGRSSVWSPGLVKPFRGDALLVGAKARMSYIGRAARYAQVKPLLGLKSENPGC